MKQMTFEEWDKANPDIDLECDECEGTGSHECSCGHEHDCLSCAGTGSQKKRLYLVQAKREKALILEYEKK